MKKKTITAIIMIMLVAAMAFGVTACGSAETKKAATESSKAKDLKLDENQGAFVPETQAVDPAKNITMPGWASFTIDKDTTDINRGVDFYNPEANEGYYYMTFELLVDVDGKGEMKSLYQSGLVEPGNHIQKITLSEPLKSGTYQANVFIQPYSIDNLETPLNNGGVQIELYVQ